LEVLLGLIFDKGYPWKRSIVDGDPYDINAAVGSENVHPEL